jgi:hypothetical protein
VEVGQIREGTYVSTSWAVGQDSGSNDRPVETALANLVFLPILVMIGRSQKQRLSDVIVQEAAMAMTVSRANTGNTHQARDPLLLHRVDQDARRGGEERLLV